MDNFQVQQDAEQVVDPLPWTKPLRPSRRQKEAADGPIGLGNPRAVKGVWSFSMGKMSLRTEEAELLQGAKQRSKRVN